MSYIFILVAFAATANCTSHPKPSRVWDRPYGLPNLPLESLGNPAGYQRLSSKGKLCKGRSKLTIPNTMTELPKVIVHYKTYYHDERLKQYRNVENPHDYVDYSNCELCYEGNCPHTCHGLPDFIAYFDD